MTAPPETRPPTTVRGLSLSRLWAFLAVALPVVAALEATISTNDSAYLVRAGELMLQDGGVLRSDPFSFTASGAEWLNQQWLAEILFALAYRAGGWEALAVFRAALVGATYLFVFLAARGLGTSVKASAWLTLAAFGLTFGGLALRSQLLGMALFAVTLYLLSARRRRPGLVWLVPVVAALWANVHGSFFLGPILALLAWLQDRREGSPQARTTFRVTVFAVLATLANPFGLRVWSYLWELSTHPLIRSLVSEWQPTTIRDSAGLAFFLSVVGITVLLARRPGRATWPTLVALGVFFLVGLSSIRGTFWWGLAAPVLVAPILFPRAIADEHRADDRPSRANTAIAAVVLALGISFLPWLRDGNPLVPSEGLLVNAPTALTQELREVLAPGERMFNSVTLASWFELELPGHPVFLDQRIEVFPLTVAREHLRISSGRADWRELLDKWQIRVFVADRAEQGGLIPLMREDPGWRVVYEDDQALIFVRT